MRTACLTGVSDPGASDRSVQLGADPRRNYRGEALAKKEGDVLELMAVGEAACVSEHAPTGSVELAAPRPLAASADRFRSLIEREGTKLVTADQPFARLLRTNGMDRLVLSLEEIGSSAKDAKLD